MLLTAKMAASGSLKELLRGTLDLFKGTIDSAKGNATAVAVEPAKSVDSTRDKGVAGRPDWHPIPASWPKNQAGVQACYNLNLDLKFGQSVGQGAKDWHDQMENLASCVNANEENPEAADFLRYGNNVTVQPGKSLLAMMVDLIKDIIPADDDSELKAVYDELTDLMIDEPTFQDTKELNRMLPLLFGKRYCSTYNAPDDETNPPYSCARGTEEVAVMQAVGRLSSVIKNRGEDLQQLLNVAKVATVQPKGPRAGIFLYDKYMEADETRTAVVADIKPPLESYPLNGYSSKRGAGGNHILRKMLDDAIRTWELREPTVRFMVR
jgi:hypothetical protein